MTLQHARLLSHLGCHSLVKAHRYDPDCVLYAWLRQQSEGQRLLLICAGVHPSKSLMPHADHWNAVAVHQQSQQAARVVRTALIPRLLQQPPADASPPLCPACLPARECQHLGAAARRLQPFPGPALHQTQMQKQTVLWRENCVATPADADIWSSVLWPCLHHSTWSIMCCPHNNSIRSPVLSHHAARPLATTTLNTSMMPEKEHLAAASASQSCNSLACILHVHHVQSQHSLLKTLQVFCYLEGGHRVAADQRVPPCSTQPLRLRQAALDPALGCCAAPSAPVSSCADAE